MSDDSPPIKKIKKVSSEVNSPKNSKFLDEIVAGRKQVNKFIKKICIH